jgi:nucleoside-diphosphate-sugar epimerase
MRCVVTGATGFLGSFLAKRLISDGHDVICPVRKDAIIPGATIIKEDFKGSPLADFEGDVDVFFNNIGQISDKLSKKQLWEANVELQEKLVYVAKRLGAKRYIHVSSTSAGGVDSKPGIKTEDDECGSGLGYGDSKLEGEKLVLAKCKELDMECVILRPTLIYGKMKAGVIGKIIKVMKTPLRMIGSGKQTWHMVHVEDVVDACILAVTKTGINGMVFNIAGPDPMPADKVVDIVCYFLKTRRSGLRLPSGVVYAVAVFCETFMKKKPPVTKFACKLLTGNHHYDIGKARKYLGFEPKKVFASELPSLFGASRED